MSNDYHDLDDKDLDDKINESKDEYIKHLHDAIRNATRDHETHSRVIAEKNIYIEQLENKVQVLMGRYSKIEKILAGLGFNKEKEND